MWLADHDLDIPGEGQIKVYSGRGILSESQGPVWLIGTSMFCLINPHVRRAHQYFVQAVGICLSRFDFASRLVTAEHHVIYQYHLAGAANHYMGLIQTESVFQLD